MHSDRLQEEEMPAVQAGPRATSYKLQNLALAADNDTVTRKKKIEDMMSSTTSFSGAATALTHTRQTAS